MAYKPSQRRHSTNLDNTDINMTPIMNLMVVLIPLLLTSAQLIKISVIEVNLPPAAKPGMTHTQPVEKNTKLDLAVIITDEGFYLSSSGSILKTLDGPAIPKVDGEYDYTRLAESLYKIKQQVTGRFEDASSIVIQAEPKVNYQTLVSTMDAARSIEVNRQTVELFPDVSFSAKIL